MLHQLGEQPEVTTPTFLLRPTKLAAIALANKLARMAWAMMATGARYNYPASLRV
jgi:transposase